MSLLTLAGVLLLTGCDDPFLDPFVTGKHYTVYGYLHEFDQDHFVRVIPVRRFPEDIPTPTSPHAEIDAVVTSTDLTNGVTRRWTHTLRRLDDGNYGHVFHASFVVNRGHQYELTVTRSDGARSIARTKVPNFQDWTALPARIERDSVIQTIRWAGIKTPENIDVSYCAKIVGGFSCRPIVVPYRRKGTRTAEGWEVEVDLGRDLLFVRQQLGHHDDVTLELASLEMMMTSLDADWVVPAEPIDPIQFGQPDALSNVENGFGFWGSIARSNAVWMPEAEALAVRGFVPP